MAVRSVTGLAAGTDTDRADSDGMFLDVAFCQLLDAAEEGRDDAIDALVSQRPDLSRSLYELADLARNVAVAPRGTEPLPELPGYELVTEIGRGGMGRVFLARQRAAGDRPVAVKLLPWVSGIASGRERMRREAISISALQHRHIVRVHDVLRVENSDALVMEFIEGGSLQEMVTALAAADFPQGTDEHHISLVAGALGGTTHALRASSYSRLVARIGLQIADALHTVHSGGMLHRDVKPSNILLQRDGTALLSDFGLVQEVRDRTITTLGGFAGTPAYSSPEQLRSAERLDARSDVYSLGATLFHALTLRRPHAGDSAVQVLRSIEHGSPQAAPRVQGPRAARVPRDLEVIVRKAMDPDRDRRYATAAELAADLGRFLEDRPIRARPVSLLVHASKFASRNRRSVFTGLLVAFAVGLVAGGVLVRATVLPKWSAAALQSARSHVLHPGRSEDIFNFAFWELIGDPRRFIAGSTEATEPTRFVRALGEYDRAIALGDWSDATSAERDALALVTQQFGRREVKTRAPIGPGVSSHLRWLLNPVAQADSLRPVEERVSPVIARLQELSIRDVRQIGLVSVALRDLGTAIAAWAELEARGSDDPFGAGVLGSLYLIQGRPALAHARLQRAVIAFPDSPEFLAAAADAALACGDTVLGRRFLDLARQVAGADPVALRRLELLARFDEGKADEVCAEVAHAFASGGNGQVVSVYLPYQLAMRAKAIGRKDLVFEMSALACAGAPSPRRALRLFAPMAIEYWNNASHDERRRVIIEWARLSSPVVTWRSVLPAALHQAAILIPEQVPDAAVVRAGVDDSMARLRQLLDRRDSTKGLPWIGDLDEPLRVQAADWVLDGDGPFPEAAAAVLRERLAASKQR